MLFSDVKEPVPDLLTLQRIAECLRATGMEVTASNTDELLARLHGHASLEAKESLVAGEKYFKVYRVSLEDLNPDGTFGKVHTLAGVCRYEGFDAAKARKIADNDARDHGWMVSIFDGNNFRKFTANTGWGEYRVYKRESKDGKPLESAETLAASDSELFPVNAERRGLRLSEAAQFAKYQVAKFRLENGRTKPEIQVLVVDESTSKVLWGFDV